MYICLNAAKLFHFACLNLKHMSFKSEKKKKPCGGIRRIHADPRLIDGSSVEYSKYYAIKNCQLNVLYSFSAVIKYFTHHHQQKKRVKTIFNSTRIAS